MHMKETRLLGFPRELARELACWGEKAVVLAKTIGLDKGSS